MRKYLDMYYAHRRRHNYGTEKLFGRCADHLASDHNNFVIGCVPKKYDKKHLLHPQQHKHNAQ